MKIIKKLDNLELETIITKELLKELLLKDIIKIKGENKKWN